MTDKSRFEFEQHLRGAFQQLFPVPIGKMKKQEIARAAQLLKATFALNDVVPSEPVSTRGKPGPRAVSVKEVLAGDTKITVPTVPDKRVFSNSTAEEKKAYREKVGVTSQGSHVGTAKPRGRPKKAPTKEALAAEVASIIAGPEHHPLFPGMAPHAAVHDKAVEEDVDPRAAKIVKSHAAKKVTVVDPAPAPTPASSKKASPTAPAKKGLPPGLLAYQEKKRAEKAAKLAQAAGTSSAEVTKPAGGAGASPSPAMMEAFQSWYKSQQGGGE